MHRYGILSRAVDREKAKKTQLMKEAKRESGRTRLCIDLAAEKKGRGERRLASRGGRGKIWGTGEFGEQKRREGHAKSSL